MLYCIKLTLKFHERACFKSRYHISSFMVMDWFLSIYPLIPNSTPDQWPLNERLRTYSTSHLVLYFLFGNRTTVLSSSSIMVIEFFPILIFVESDFEGVCFLSVSFCRVKVESLLSKAFSFVSGSCAYAEEIIPKPNRINNNRFIILDI